MSTKKILSNPDQELPGNHHPRFERIWLVDDNDIDLFINETIINTVKLSRKVRRELNGQNVIMRLKNIERLSDVPELIFLDLKMNDYDGFVFLEEFSKLSDFIRNKCKIVIVTYSESKEDKLRALMNPSVIRYLEKPLDVYKLKDFIQS